MEQNHETKQNDDFSEYENRMLDEGLYGANFLVRMKRPNGSFFESITALGTGGGMAIAALALASTMPQDGDFPCSR